MKLTIKNATALKLPAGKTDHIEFDDEIPGFGLRIRRSGNRSWIFQYRIAGKTRRYVIGKATAIPADEARKVAWKLHGKMKAGGDPATERHVRIAEATKTFGNLVADYLETKAGELRPRSLVEVRRHLDVHLAPLHKLPMAAIGLETVAERLEAIAKESGRVTANRVRASLSAMFARAMMQGRATSNPAALTVKHKEPSRKRALSNAEIAAIWRAAQDDEYGRIIRLLTLTGARLNEIAGLRWSEISDDAIILPAERVKNGNEHEIYLAPAARTILKSQPQRYNADGTLRDLVFGEGAHGFSSWTENKKALDAAIARNGKPLPHWTHHDLRRSAATRMAEDLEILPHVIEAVPNHLSGHKSGIAGVYNLASYSREKKQALTLWAEHVTAIVAGRKSKIVSLRQRA